MPQLDLRAICRTLQNVYGSQAAIAVSVAVEVAQECWTEKHTKRYGTMAHAVLNDVVLPDEPHLEALEGEPQEPSLCHLCNAPATDMYCIVQHGKDLVTPLCERCLNKI